MKTIQDAMIEEIYQRADEIAKRHNQVIGEKRNYYITLEQLMNILSKFED